ncbi:hypothetical protein ACJIZ3_017080 [Penstemon smallii]|uniref:Cyclopropane-fatty-acyl-phospholipid synthase n=1 Tax=Penstemon smallii TaxID=265156 RepID=A0ABD3SUX4_9LAMI
MAVVNYDQIAKESDLGFADAYINGDFTFVDKKDGLSEGEDLKIAQLRKLQKLIDKAKVNKEHHVLEIGSGWGSLAIELC